MFFFVGKTMSFLQSIWSFGNGIFFSTYKNGDFPGGWCVDHPLFYQQKPIYRSWSDCGSWMGFERADRVLVGNFMKTGPLCGEILDFYIEIWDFYSKILNFYIEIWDFFIVNYWTGWWFGTWIFFSPTRLVMMIQSDELFFFSEGWNHQPVDLYSYWTLMIFGTINELEMCVYVYSKMTCKSGFDHHLMVVHGMVMVMFVHNIQQSSRTMLQPRWIMAEYGQWLIKMMDQLYVRFHQACGLVKGWINRWICCGDSANHHAGSSDIGTSQQLQL